MALRLKIESRDGAKIELNMELGKYRGKTWIWAITGTEPEATAGVKAEIGAALKPKCRGRGPGHGVD